MENHVPRPATGNVAARKTVCPCCGFKFRGELRNGCEGCGVRAVGEALTRPARELPYLGRAVFIAAVGAGLLLALLATTIVVLIQRPPANFDLLNIATAAEFAVWKFKLVMVPAALFGFWASWKLRAGIRRDPAKFVSGRAVRLGIVASGLAVLAIATLIGVTVPARIQSYRISVDAEQYAKAYAYDRALTAYRNRFGTFPTVPSDLRKLPDPDGTIAELLKDSNQSTYRPWTELASASTDNVTNPKLTGSDIRQVSINSGTDVVESEPVSFTSYELRTPGADGVYGTEDDVLIRDGMVAKAGAANPAARNGAADQAKLP